MKREVLKSLLLVCVVAVMHSATAAEVKGITNFSAGTPAVASEVNGNFAAVKAAVDDNHATIATLLAAITTLQSTVADLQAKLAGVTREKVNGQPTVRFTGVNVQIVNGLNATETINGAGNLIIGYDEPNDGFTEFCSIGVNVNSPGILIANAGTCNAIGGTFASSHKSGSHNLVVGPNHNYSRFGGAVLGQRNTIINDFAVIAGGRANIAAAINSSIGGGQENKSLGTASSVSGGFSNSASGPLSSISGGWGNEATGNTSSVTGGRFNSADGLGSTVSGGTFRRADNDDDWVGGGLFQDN